MARLSKIFSGEKLKEMRKLRRQRIAGYIGNFIGAVLTGTLVLSPGGCLIGIAYMETEAFSPKIIQTRELENKKIELYEKPAALMQDPSRLLKIIYSEKQDFENPDSVKTYEFFGSLKRPYLKNVIVEYNQEIKALESYYDSHHPTAKDDSVLNYSLEKLLGNKK